MRNHTSHTDGCRTERQPLQHERTSHSRFAAAAIDQIDSLVGAGQPADALEMCQRALRVQPDHVELLFALAGLQQRIGHPVDAAATYRHILELKPTLVEAAFNLGLMHQQLGEPEAAEHCYRQVLSQDPLFSAAHNNLGTLLMDRGDLQAAAECFKTVARIEPDNTDGFFNWGRCLFELGRFEEASARFQTAVSLKPDYIKGWHNLGLSFQKTGRQDQALAALRTALELSPQSSDLYFDIGNVFLDMGDTGSVMKWYRRGVAHCPENTSRLENLAVLLQEQGRCEEAIDTLRRIVKLEPDHIQAHFNLSLLLLRSGRYEEGWREYEWRLKKPDWSKGYPWRYQRPRWQGENFSGKTLLVHCEQGYGDSLQFVRYLPMVKSRGGEVILEAPSPLLEVFRSIPGVDEFRRLSADSPPEENFDVYSPLLSLPGIFGTTPDSIPCEVPYLYADPGKCSRWHNRAPAECRRIGIVWAGSKVHVNDKRRSCSLDHFKALTQIPDLQFYSLQTEVSADQVASSGFSARMIHWGDRFQDFSDTAAAIANLDLIIAVDTATAHMAGALGKPVWLLLPFVADWRWFSDREDSPWYPSMRLFRQPAPGDWSTVFHRVGSALHQFSVSRYKAHEGG